MMTFSKSLVVEFYTLFNQGKFGSQRLGQAFHNHMKLHKCSNPADKVLQDKLYELDGDEARSFIETYTDFSH